MNQKPSLAVYVTTYNSEKTIVKCLESIDQQRTKFSIKIICIDDASSDSTQELIQNFAKSSYWPIQLIFHDENLRSKNVRYFVQHLFPIMEEDYFTIVDGDDYLSGNTSRFDKMIKSLKENENSSFCYTDTLHVYTNGEKSNFVLPEPLKKAGRILSESFFLLGNYSGIHLGACIFKNVDFEFPPEYFLQSNGDHFYPYLWGKWGDAIYLNTAGYLTYSNGEGSYSKLTSKDKELSKLIFACQFISLLLRDGNINAAVFGSTRFLPLIVRNPEFKRLYEPKLTKSVKIS